MSKRPAENFRLMSLFFYMPLMHLFSTVRADNIKML